VRCSNHKQGYAKLGLKSAIRKYLVKEFYKNGLRGLKFQKKTVGNLVMRSKIRLIAVLILFALILAIIITVYFSYFASLHLNGSHCSLLILAQG